MYQKRTLETFFAGASRQFPVVMVSGARQVGKTTFLRHMAGEDRRYVTLDDPLALQLAQNDPALFMQRFPAPVLIDEIQYAPGLLPYIKMAADSSSEKGRYWLTGSQQFHLMKGVSESLAGRVAMIDLLGMSRWEIEGCPEPNLPFLPTREEIERRVLAMPALELSGLFQAIWRGCYPALVTIPQIEWDLYYSSYVKTYLQRDVRDLARVGDQAAFLRFLRAAAARTGQLLNVADLARYADIAPNTAKSWLSILETSGIVYLLPPYFANATKRIVKTPKLYFLDSGLCSYLTGWSSPETLEAGAMSGAFLETWVLSEILKSWSHNGRRAPLYFYRDHSRREVDLLIVQDGALYPLEIKKSASPGKDAVRSFAALEALGMPVGPGGVVCLAQTHLPLTGNVSIIPVAAI